jgi:hypothetical protein
LSPPCHRFPSTYWSAGAPPRTLRSPSPAHLAGQGAGVVVNELVQGNSGLLVGDCVVAVDDRRLEDIARNGPARDYHVGDVVRHEVLRNERHSTGTARDHKEASR